MKRLLGLVLLLTAPAFAQTDMVGAPCKMTDGSCSSSSSATPATCTTAGMVPVFLGSPLAMGCDAGLTYNAATDTLTVGGLVLGTGRELDMSAGSSLLSLGSTSAIRIWGGASWDSGLRRVSAGLVGVTDGSTGQGKLQVGGLQFVTGSRPTCDASARGFVWYVAGGAGVADTIEICGKAAADTYSWVALATF